MAGYEGISMSVNAREALNKGLLPASKIQKGLPAKLIHQFCRSEEWHHTSMKYNETSYYIPDHVKATFGLIHHEKYQPNPKAIEALQNYQSALKEKKKLPPSSSIIHENCTVSWSESGLNKTRNYSYTGCTVVETGDWCEVSLPDGKKIRKKKSGKHFSFQPHPQ